MTTQLVLTPASVSDLTLSQTLNVDTIAFLGAGTISSTSDITIKSDSDSSGAGDIVFRGGATTNAAVASVCPPFTYDAPNEKIKSRGLLLGDIGDTPDLGLRRAEGTASTPTSVASSTTISRIYFQAYGDNGPFAADFDTPTTGQHQAAWIGAVAQENASYLATTVNGAVSSGASSLTVASAAGFSPTTSGGGRVYVQASDGTYLTVSYTTLSGSTLSGCTGITKDISNAANVYVFTRGTDLEFCTTPTGSDANVLRVTIDSTGLTRFYRDTGAAAVHIVSSTNGVRMSAGASVGTPEWMLTKIASSQWAIDCDDLSFRTTAGSTLLNMASSGVALSGSPTATTAATGTTSTRIATTAFVAAQARAMFSAFGYLAETFVRNVFNTSAATSQTIYFMPVYLWAGDAITNLDVIVAGNGTTVTNAYLAVYDSTANRVAVSADVASSFNSGSVPRLQATAVSYTVPTSGVYYLAVLFNGGTPASLVRAGSTSGNAYGFAPAGGIRPFATQTGQSSMPSTATLADGNGNYYWIGAR